MIKADLDIPENVINEVDEFLDKINILCWEYGYEFILVKGNDGEHYLSIRTSEFNVLAQRKMNFLKINK